MQEIIESLSKSNFYKIVRSILAVIGLLWLSMRIIHSTTYDIRIGYEDSDITLHIKKFWGIKQETYFVEFSQDDKKWKYLNDYSNKNRWAKINKNSRHLPLPEKVGIYDNLPTYEREYEDFD